MRLDRASVIASISSSSTVKQLLEKRRDRPSGSTMLISPRMTLISCGNASDACESKGLAERGWFAIPEREIAIRIVSDSAEFQHLKTATAEPNTALPNQNGAWAF